MVQAAVDFQNITQIGRSAQASGISRFIVERVTFSDLSRKEIGETRGIDQAGQQENCQIPGMQMTRLRQVPPSKGTKMPGMYLRYQFSSENKTRIYLMYKWRAWVSGQNLPDQNGETNSGPDQGRTLQALSGLWSGWSHPGTWVLLAVVPVWRPEVGSGGAISPYNTL